MVVAKEQRNEECTVYVGNLDSKVDEALLNELFTQAGPVESVFLPRDKVTGVHHQYGFVEFKSAIDAEYAAKIMNMIKLFGSSIRVNKRGDNQRMQNEMGVGANLFIGNLDEMVDDKMLHDTFSAFGVVLSVQVMHHNNSEDPEFNSSDAPKSRFGNGFVRFDCFEASDLAIQCMNDQWLCNRQIKVEYAFKKGSSTEKHGSHAERLLAQEMQARAGAASSRPNMRFATEGGPPMAMNPMVMPPPPFMMMPPPSNWNKPPM